MKKMKICGRFLFMFLLTSPVSPLLFAQQIIKFRNGHGFNTKIISSTKDTVRYSLTADPFVTRMALTNEIENIFSADPDQLEGTLKHQKYKFWICENGGKSYKVNLISLTDSTIYFQERPEEDQKMNVYLWYNNINEVIIKRKTHIGPYAGLAAGFIGGVVITFTTPKTTSYSSFSMVGPSQTIYSTSYPNWWTMFAGAAVGAVIGTVIEAIAKKKIRLKINSNHDDFMKIKPVIESKIIK